MDQKIIIDTIEKHLDSLEAAVSWIIVIAIAAAWAGVQREKEIEVLGLKFNRRNAFFAVSALYLIANMGILILFLRMGKLVQLLDQGNFLTGFTKLTTHSWVLNPFSYFGGSDVVGLHSGEGYGLLIVVWWLCNTSLYTLMDDKKNKIAYFLLGLFLIIGLGSMFAIQNTIQIVLDKLLNLTPPSIYKEFFSTLPVRTIAAILGAVAGCLLFTAANILQQRRLSLKK